MSTLTVPEESDAQRADAVVAMLCGISRSEAAEWIGQQRVRWAQDRTQGRAAGAPVKKSERLPAGSLIHVAAPAPKDPIKVEAVQDLNLLYQDADVVVVDKPVGVAAHPSPGWQGPTVIGGLLAAGYRVATSGAAERQGIVHRLDVGTSGLMVVAKTELAYSALKRAFKERTVQKVYHALVQGHMDPLAGTIDAPVGRDPRHDYRFAVVAGGKPAVTHYETLEAMPGASLLEIDLETGRTHQIRVHTSAVRHPCVGDVTYGADPVLAQRPGLTRQWPHAGRLGFAHPPDGPAGVGPSDYPRDPPRRPPGT